MGSTNIFNALSTFLKAAVLISNTDNFFVWKKIGNGGNRTRGSRVQKQVCCPPPFVLCFLGKSSATKRARYLSQLGVWRKWFTCWLAKDCRDSGIFLLVSFFSLLFLESHVFKCTKKSLGGVGLIPQNQAQREKPLAWYTTNSKWTNRVS